MAHEGEGAGIALDVHTSHIGSAKELWGWWVRGRRAGIEIGKATACHNDLDVGHPGHFDR